MAQQKSNNILSNLIQTAIVALLCWAGASISKSNEDNAVQTAGMVSLREDFTEIKDLLRDQYPRSQIEDNFDTIKRRMNRLEDRVEELEKGN